MLDINLILFLLLFAVVILSLLFIEDLFSMVLITGIISVLSAIIYTILDAVDVAFTEIVVGAGVSTILMLITMHLTRSYNITGNNPSTKHVKKFIFSTILILIVLVIFIDSLAYAPIFGDGSTPANSNVIYQVYSQDSYNVYKVQNAVTMILGSFRGYDTLGETTVVLIAAVGVYLVLQKEIKNHDILDKATKETIKKPVFSIPKRGSLLSSGVFALMPIILLYAFYVQFHGDFGPGGGFQAGVILAATYFLMILYFGKSIANKFMNIKSLLALLGIGVLIYAGVGIITMLLGGKYLDYYMLGQEISHSYHYGLFIIELGVGITVFAAMSTIISQFYNKLKN